MRSCDELKEEPTDLDESDAFGENVTLAFVIDVILTDLWEVDKLLPEQFPE